jgi:cytochrome c biogenesis protein CcmG/thiol:disulfide interchange protein DsbE
MQLKRDGVIPIHGIDWREKDRHAGPAWLARYGDPYTLVGDDPDSRAAIAFGVTGAPETFIVDARGVIRYKHVGPITPENWDETLLPIVRRLQAGG